VTLTRAILLLGPTGAGKSPLGDQIEKKGFRGKRCVHFDFGHELRTMAVLPAPPAGWREEDVVFIRDVLDRGLLLENEHFHIAETILHDFIRRNNCTGEDLLILNGLPRHTDQAKALSSIVTVTRVVILECPSDVVCRRIALNSGRDRTCRVDDHLDMIEKKLAIFNARTAPLVAYYAERCCDILKVNITALSTPADIYDAFIDGCPAA
jgi:adenylate kinase